jgi:ATP phosphoribosyltransferase regulatory subunit
VLLLAIDCLLHLGVTDIKLALGHVGFFNGIVSFLNLSQAQADALRAAIDHKDCASLAREVEGLDISPEKKRFLAGLPNYAGGKEVLEEALAVVENPRSRDALRALEEIQGVMESLDLADLVAFDLSEVRGLDYYTGIVFKIYGRSLGFEMGGGGRYDGLLAKFGWDLPAVGFSFTLDHLLPLIPCMDALQIPPAGQEALTLATERVSMRELFGEAWRLRRQGFPIHVGRRRSC